MEPHAKKKIRYIAAFLLLGAGVFLFAAWNICVGTVKISVSDILASVGGKKIENARILWDIRMPRTLAALILGGALALAGYLLQTFFHNPIAGPFVLGISSGAKMIVALVMVFLMGRAVRVSSFMLIAAAFSGAMLSMGFVLLMSRRVDNMSMLVVSGVMIGYICSAVTELVVTFANDADIVNLHNWSRGSFSGMTWDNVAVMAGITAITVMAVLLLSKPLGAYRLGEAYARNLGVNIPMLRVALVVLSSILSACIVAFAGPISFVGVAVPHLVKSLLGTAKPIVIIPACFLGGSAFCLFCDLLARTLFAPTELSISTVTAVFGAPVVLWIMIRRSVRSTSKAHASGHFAKKY
ncbi:MAG: iron ABC transporter permease [Lachnoclostridium sp.]|nr:iron ABC transporter permease [Lachnospira sp.]MCM1247177.1 iron ABC transporter permease [Lachnoclostridium sp.]MCM1534602.1 iron ABC transporter permease [Clostridium sp.]